MKIEIYKVKLYFDLYLNTAFAGHYVYFTFGCLLVDWSVCYNYMLGWLVCEKVLLKGYWQQNISTFYIKVFDLNNQNVAV